MKVHTSKHWCWESQESLERSFSDAVKAGHPKHALARVSDEMKNVLEGVVLGDAFEVRSKCFGGSFPG